MRVTAAESLWQLAEEYWEKLLRWDPILATFYGDHRYNERLPDVGASARDEQKNELEQVLNRLGTISGSELGDEDRITADMLRLAVEAGLDQLRLRFDELGVDQMNGPQVWLPELVAWQPTDTAERAEQLVARFRAFDTFVDQYLTNLADGVREGRTAPTIAVERVIDQLRALMAQDIETSPFVARVQVAQREIASELREAVASTVYPALSRILDYLSADDGYLANHARREPGIWSVTDGAEMYSILARLHTTTTLTPDELHEIGREDLARIHGEMRQIMAR
jgi:uncharacterized protein (DUF885 family)